MSRQGLEMSLIATDNYSGLGGFLLSLSPLSCFLMNWRGTATGLGAADISVYLFFGGVLMNVAGFLEV